MDVDGLFRFVGDSHTAEASQARASSPGVATNRSAPREDPQPGVVMLAEEVRHERAPDDAIVEKRPG